MDDKEWDKEQPFDHGDVEFGSDILHHTVEGIATMVPLDYRESYVLAALATAFLRRLDLHADKPAVHKASVKAMRRALRAGEDHVAEIEKTQSDLGIADAPVN